MSRLSYEGVVHDSEKEKELTQFVGMKRPWKPTVNHAILPPVQPIKRNICISYDQNNQSQCTVFHDQSNYLKILFAYITAVKKPIKHCYFQDSKTSPHHQTEVFIFILLYWSILNVSPNRAFEQLSRFYFHLETSKGKLLSQSL